MANNPDDFVHGIAQLDYRYNLQSHDALLEIAGGHALGHVEYSDNIPDSHIFAMELVHPNYLPVSAIHSQGNAFDANRPPNTPDIRVHKWANSYQQHVLELRARQIFPVMFFQPGGETAGCFYVPEEYRMFVRGAISLILYIHSRNRALIVDSLTLDNLRHNGRELMITGVDFEEVNLQTIYGRFRDDWRLLRRLIIDAMFLGFDTRRAVDMNDLTHRLDNYGSILDEDLMENHLAIKDSLERIQFVERCWEKRTWFDSVYMTHQYRDAIQNMPDYSGWINNRFGNPNSVFSAVQRVTRGVANLRGNYSDWPNNTLVTNQNLIRCARNVATHLHENFVQQYFDDHVRDIMLMGTFGDVLVQFNYWLWRQNLAI